MDAPIALKLNFVVFYKIIHVGVSRRDDGHTFLIIPLLYLYAELVAAIGAVLLWLDVAGGCVADKL